MTEVPASGPEPIAARAEIVDPRVLVTKPLGSADDVIKSALEG